MVDPGGENSGWVRGSWAKQSVGKNPCRGVNTRPKKNMTGWEPGKGKKHL